MAVKQPLGLGATASCGTFEFEPLLRSIRPVRSVHGRGEHTAISRGREFPFGVWRGEQGRQMIEQDVLPAIHYYRHKKGVRSNFPSPDKAFTISPLPRKQGRAPVLHLSDMKPF
jgi:hypothetical protein